jgi:site-specific DNA-methyltransferase (adenine-specific)
MQTILVINALNGTLALVLRNKYPSARITCAEVFPFYKHHLLNLGFEVVDWETIGDMKFDLVIGNPPYQNTHGAKRWPIWHEFVVKSVNLSNHYVMLVTPNSWIGAGENTAKQLIWQNAKSASLDVDKFFNVGSTFSWFLLDLKKHHPTFDLKTPQDMFVVDKSTPWLPAQISENALSVNKKIFGKESFVFKRGECHSSHKENFSTSGYEVFHTQAQTLFYNKEPMNYSKTKVSITLSGYSLPKVGKNFGVSQAAAYMVIPDKHAKNAQSVFASKLYQWALTHNKWSGWNSLDVIKSLPKVDLSKSWTDTDLYVHFGLTDQEIQFVESSQ